MANANWDFSGLTATRTYTWPDASGTVALDTGSTNITTVGTIGTGTWHGTKIGLAYGGTNADLSGTGGTSQVLKQSSVGANISVEQLDSVDITNLAVSQSATPATGATVSVTAFNGVNKSLYINPAGGLAALTLALADGTAGQTLHVIFTKAITTLTITGNYEDPGSKVGPAVAANQAIILTWIASSGKWEVVYGTN